MPDSDLVLRYTVTLVQEMIQKDGWWREAVDEFTSEVKIIGSSNYLISTKNDSMSTVIDQ
jgi:hypothetical protein